MAPLHRDIAHAHTEEEGRQRDTGAQDAGVLHNAAPRRNGVV